MDDVDGKLDPEKGGVSPGIDQWNGEAKDDADYGQPAAENGGRDLNNESKEMDNIDSEGNDSSGQGNKENNTADVTDTGADHSEKGNREDGKPILTTELWKA